MTIDLAAPLTGNAIAVIAVIGNPDLKALRARTGVTEAQAELIAVPALIIGNAMDAVHPEAYAERLAAVLPRATLTSVTPKALDRAAYTQQVHDDIVNFLAAIDREPS